MATKKTLSADLAKRVNAMGIATNNEDAAREKLLEILQKNDIDGMEEEDTITLVEIAESFYDGTETPAPAAEEPANSAKETEEELDNLAAEVEGEQAEEAEEEEEEHEEEESDKFDKMSRNELKKYNTENELGVTVKKNMTDDDLRDAIRAAEAASENTAPAPEKKAAKKAEKPAPAKKEKKADEKKPSKRGTKLNPKDSEEDRQHFAEIMKLFPEDEYNYAWVVTSGVTIKHKGANGQRGIALLENCSLQADGSVKCNLYLLTMTKQTEVLDEAGIDYEICWTKAPYMKGITLEAAHEILEKVHDAIVATVTKIDKRLGDNREKMEKNLKGAAKKSAKK